MHGILKGNIIRFCLFSLQHQSEQTSKSVVSDFALPRTYTYAHSIQKKKNSVYLLNTQCKWCLHSTLKKTTIMIFAEMSHEWTMRKNSWSCFSILLLRIWTCKFLLVISFFSAFFFIKPYFLSNWLAQESESDKC